MLPSLLPPPPKPIIYRVPFGYAWNALRYHFYVTYINSIGYYFTDAELELHKDMNLVSSLYTEHFYNHMCELFPHASQFSETRLVSYNSIQF